MYLNPHECKTPNVQLFSYSRKEHTDSTCYFYMNRRVRIAYSEYRIAYSEYHIPYTVYFYVNAALGCVRYTLYGHGGSYRSSTCFQCALFVSIKKLRIRYFEKIFAFTSRGGGGGGNT